MQGPVPEPAKQLHVVELRSGQLNTHRCLKEEEEEKEEEGEEEEDQKGEEREGKGRKAHDYEIS